MCEEPVPGTADPCQESAWLPALRGDQTILLRRRCWPTTLGGMYPRHPDPTPEEIQQACEELQRDWTDAEYYRRSHFSLGKSRADDAKLR